MIELRASGGLGLAFVLSMTGCAGLPVCTTFDTQYVLVERTASQKSGVSQQARITDTPTYKTLHGGFKTVALRLPDNCYQAEVLHSGENQDAAQLESKCGIPLQVLERTLTTAGYQVLSWTTLMGIEHQQNVPVHIAAQQLGADFVIVVNAMYVGLEKAGGEAEARYRYFTSDVEGARGQPAELFEADRSWVKKFVRDRVGNDPQAEGAQTLQARLNATIVLARGPDAAAAAPTTPGAPPPAASAPGSAPLPGSAAAPRPAPVVATSVPGVGRSGEAIWFYNWSLSDVDAREEGMRFLLAGLPVGQYRAAFPDGEPIDQSDPNRHYWWPLSPLHREVVPEARHDKATSEESFESKIDASPEHKVSLYQRIAKDFIDRFKGG